MQMSYVEIFTYEKTQSPVYMPGPHIYTTSYTLLYFHCKETNLMRFHVPCFPLNGTQNKPIYIWMLAIHMWNYDSCVKKSQSPVKKKIPRLQVQLYIFFHVFLSRANVCENMKITWGEIDHTGNSAQRPKNNSHHIWNSSRENGITWNMPFTCRIIFCSCVKILVHKCAVSVDMTGVSLMRTRRLSSAVSFPLFCSLFSVCCIRMQSASSEWKDVSQQSEQCN